MNGPGHCRQAAEDRAKHLVAHVSIRRAEYGRTLGWSDHYRLSRAVQTFVIRMSAKSTLIISPDPSEVIHKVLKP